MRNTLKNYLTPLIATAAFVLMPLAGCNTVEGAGEDISEAGEAIQDSAE